VQINDSPASVNGGLTRQAPWFFGYAFGSVDGRAVGRDITLDGNSFRGGPSVATEAHERPAATHESQRRRVSCP
jgi:hypothetical protein